MKSVGKWAGLAILPLLPLLAVPAPGEIVRDRFQIKLSGGVSASDDGDIARVIDGMEDYHRDLAEMYGKTKTGSLKWPVAGWSFGLDFEMALSERFSLGLGLNPSRKSKAGSIRLTPDVWMNMDGKGELSALPLTLFGVYRFPGGDNIELYLKGGPSYIWIKNVMDYRLESGIGWWETKHTSIRDSGFGFIGGLGVALRISRSISFTAEVLMRWAQFSNWTGEYDRVNSDGRTDHVSGPLWFEEVMWDTGKYYPEGVIGDPEVPHPTRLVRDFKVDFTGMALTAGLKIRLL